MARQFYGADLSFIHDSGFTQFARDAGTGLLRLLRSVPGKDIVELGCGSGRMAKILIREGYNVRGVDVSPAMIALARKNAPRGRFSTGSLWEYRIPACGAVVSVGEVLNYSFTGRISSRRLERLFRRVYNSLLPSGLFLFDILCVRSSHRVIQTKSYTASRDWVVAVEKTDSRRAVTRKIISFRRSGGAYRRSEEIHTAQRLDVAKLALLMRRAGFAVATRPGYHDRPLGSGHLVVIGRKPKSARHVKRYSAKTP
jgi:SAM-dependent methyltransferase